MQKEGLIVHWMNILNKSLAVRPKMYDLFYLVVNDLKKVKSAEGFEKVPVDCLKG